MKSRTFFKKINFYIGNKHPVSMCVCLTHRCCVVPAADGWRVAVGVGQIAVSLCRRVERQSVIRDAVLSRVVLCGKSVCGAELVLRGMPVLRGVRLGHVRWIAGLLVTLQTSMQTKAYIKPPRPSHIGPYVQTGCFYLSKRASDGPIRENGHFK